MRSKNNMFGLTVIIIVIIALGLYLFETPEDISELDEVLEFAPSGVDYFWHEIQTDYSGGDTIKGNVNLSFDNALAGASVSSNFEGDLTLFEFLDNQIPLNEGADYTCSTPDCLDDFTADASVSSLFLADEEIIGFQISGPQVSVLSAEFSVESDIGLSCSRQLTIDVLNDEDNFIINNRHTDVGCLSPDYGCFDSGAVLGDAIIGKNDQYCEKIALPSGPAYRIGAKVQNSTDGLAELKMEFYDENLVSLGSCILPEHSQDIEELGCVVEFSSVFQGDYFVCINSDSDRDYKIKTETSGETCGTGNLFGGGDLNRDYEIFGQTLEFDSFDSGNKLIVDDDLFGNLYQGSLTSYIDSYIIDKYNRDCQSSCIVPVRFFGQGQTLTFSDVNILYDSDGTNIQDNSLYDLSIEKATLSSGELELDLEEADFVIPLDSDENDFEFFIDNDLVFEEEIEITESFDFDVNPKFVAFGQEVLFKADTSETINSSTWDFGDGTVETADGKEAKHRYIDSEESEFELEVKLVSDEGLTSTKRFTISVGDAQEIANQTIADYNNRIIDLKEDISLFPSWIQGELNDRIDIEGLEIILNGIEEEYDSAVLDDEYQDVMLALISLDVPFAIKVGEKGDLLPLFIGFDNVDISFIETISGESVGSEDEELKSSISGWMSENFNAVISFEQIDSFYDDDIETIISKFKISTNPSGNVEDISYLIIGHDVESSGMFMSGYGQKRLTGGATYITLEIGEAVRTLEFYIEGEFEPEELGSYISPQISRLGDFDDGFSPCNFDNVCQEGENTDNCPADCGSGRLKWFFLWLVVLVFVALVVYIILQEWYKKNYQRHLFKNPNDLYNLINFIYNARKAGLGDGDIRRKLGGSGWKGEKINYAFKKINGKRTGMYEIPLFKFIENRKVKQELEKRQKRPVDLRFVRKPRRM